MKQSKGGKSVKAKKKSGKRPSNSNLDGFVVRKIYENLKFLKE